MDGPENYKSPELLSDLALKVQDYMFLSTGDVKYRSNPLIGAPDSMVRGEVRELTSLETGIIGLQTGETVLFHLDQVIKINIIFERFPGLIFTGMDSLWRKGSLQDSPGHSAGDLSTSRLKGLGQLQKHLC